MPAWLLTFILIQPGVLTVMLSPREHRVTVGIWGVLAACLAFLNVDVGLEDIPPHLLGPMLFFIGTLAGRHYATFRAEPPDDTDDI